MNTLILSRLLVANIQTKTSALWQKLKDFFENYNLFPSIPPSTDEYQLRKETISTRLFILLLILSLFVLLLYTSLVENTQTINVQSPTIKQYSELYSTYAETLTCPCTKISIDYGKLLHVNYTLHQVCTSVLVTQEWINYITQYRLNSQLNLHDFRSTITKVFQGLTSFCNLVNERISNDLIQFYSTQFLGVTLAPVKIFESQAQSLIDQFISSTIKEFSLSFSMIRSTTQSNKLLSGLLTNYNFLATPQQRLTTLPQIYGNCSCDLSATCSEEAAIYDYSGNITLFIVPGFYIGCYVIESLLQSNLQCFYN